MIRILALTAMDSSADLNDAVAQVTARQGNVLSMEKLYFRDFEQHNTSLDPVREALRRADIILIGLVWLE